MVNRAPSPLPQRHHFLTQLAQLGLQAAVLRHQIRDIAILGRGLIPPHQTKRRPVRLTDVLQIPRRHVPRQFAIVARHLEKRLLFLEERPLLGGRKTSRPAPPRRATRNRQPTTRHPQPPTTKTRHDPLGIAGHAHHDTIRGMSKRTQAAPTAEVWRRFRPTPSQLRFLQSTAFGRLFSSGYGSGKSSTGCRESIDWAVKHAGSRNLVGRLTATDLRTTTQVTYFKELRTAGFQEGAHYTFNKSNGELAWWNGSITYFTHLDDPDALGSLELSSAFIDEGSEVADIIYITLASSRMRWHLPTCTQTDQINAILERGGTDKEIAAVPCHCPHGIWVCTNPGPSGFLKKVTRGEIPDWEWIPAKPKDNPYNPPDYYTKLAALGSLKGPDWIKRFLDGSWDAFEGQRFPMFDRNRHVLPTTFTPTSPRYEIIEGWDFGHRETFIVWIAYDPTGEEPTVVFDEHQHQEVENPKDVADAVKRIRNQHHIADRVRSLGDPAGVASSQFSAIGPITAYAAHSIYIAPCRIGKNPQARADLIAKWLTTERRQHDGTYWPSLVFGPNCTATIDSITSLRWKDTTNRLGETPREQFVKVNDHGFDALGYGILGIPPPDVAQPPPGPNPNDPMSALAQPRNDTEWVDAA